MSDALRCSVCSKEVRIVRLNARTLGLGHTTNPGTSSHAVRLARPVQRASAAELERVPPLRARSAALGARRPT